MILNVLPNIGKFEENFHKILDLANYLQEKEKVYSEKNKKENLKSEESYKPKKNDLIYLLEGGIS